ncbi:Bud site selection protein 6 [Allomyces javanicus]|nr:Bud site selection protein 6 [Allomyces javanicus]
MTAAPASPAPATAAAAAPPPSPDDARVFLSQSLQRLTASCRALLHALAEYADDPTIEEQQLSLLYTAVVKAYFYTLQDFEQYKIDVDSLRDFPLHMRDALDAVFDDMAAPAAAKAEMLDATAEEINALMTRLIRTLKDRARAYLAGNGTTGMSPPGTPLSTTSSSADYFGPRKVRKPSVLSTLSTITTTLAPPVVVVKAPPKPTPPVPVKLYLQYDTEVKRVTYPKPLPVDLPTLRHLFVQKFPVILPANAAHFPAIYIDDPRTHVQYELEDPTDVVPGSLLKLLPLTSVATPPPSIVASAPLIPPAVLAARRPQLARKLQLVRDLRGDVATLRADVVASQDAMRAAIADTLAQVHAAVKAAAQEDPDSARDRAHLAVTRPLVAASVKAVATDRAELAHAARDLRDATLATGTVETADLDAVASRRAELSSRADRAARDIDQVRPSWKGVWETELKRVVAEQGVLDAVDAALDDAAQKLDAVDKLHAQLARVAAIAETHPDAVMPRPSADRILGGRVPGEDDDEDDGFDGLASVMAELATTWDAQAAAAASTRRLRAARRTEKVRAWERTHRKDDFSWELKKLAGDGARIGVGLRRTGGVEALERARAEREKKVLAAVYAHAVEEKRRAFGADEVGAREE